LKVSSTENTICPSNTKVGGERAHCPAGRK
jgi:hypothetical protein